MPAQPAGLVRRLIIEERKFGVALMLLERPSVEAKEVGFPRGGDQSIRCRCIPRSSIGIVLPVVGVNGGSVATGARAGATALPSLIRVIGTFCGPRQESGGKIFHFREG
jgi:hypothetical protein